MKDLHRVTMSFGDRLCFLEGETHEALGVQFLGHLIQHTLPGREAQPWLAFTARC